MPYISQGRERLRPGAEFVALTPGELNFQLTSLIDAFIVHNGLSYTRINDVLGALEGAKLEFYRRVAVPYEDEKIEENGDVYSCF